ncbi:MAG: hypothetical protein AB1778_07820 [Candidatus Bipolaricaulota bacterium]
MTARPASATDGRGDEETPEPVRSIDDYVEQFAPEVQMLRTLREAIRRRAPAAAERISY